MQRVNGALLWANFHLLFWLSLIPFATAWMDEQGFAPVPTALYGVSLLMPAIAWITMQKVIIRAQGKGSPLKSALGRDLKGIISPMIYFCGILLALVAPWAGLLCYAVVTATWLVPDRRIEQQLLRGENRP